MSRWMACCVAAEKCAKFGPVSCSLLPLEPCTTEWCADKGLPLVVRGALYERSHVKNLLSRKPAKCLPAHLRVVGRPRYPRAEGAGYKLIFNDLTSSGWNVS